MKKPIYFLSFFIYLIIALSIVHVIFSNMLSTKGISLSALDSKIRMYETENYKLSEKVLALSSLTNIASSASELGFAKEKTQVVLSNSLPVARR